MIKPFSAFLLSAFFATGLWAADIDTIIDRLEANTVYDTAVAESTMSTTDRFGTTESSFKSWSRRNGDTLLEIDKGPDRGQKILRKGASVFLFYPDAEEVIRLQGSALKDSLMGSDFSYEDLTGENTIRDRYDSELIDTQTVDGHTCYHLMMTAKKRSETYRKQELWVDTELYVTVRAVLYSASGRALRELHSAGIKKIDGFNIATKTTMKDLLKKNSSTELTLENIVINRPIDDKLFSRENLTW
ncbi:MAG: outer membrane lipoprotein-sorting protein [Treponema sp.]|jgi:outer membrane lipoprotein-sorting protein|nr:outer membrane lipoprotein-sorting protein [Treponema sp.]